jgi:macrolide-specific efflux system membrane fusion protein
VGAAVVGLLVLGADGAVAPGAAVPVVRGTVTVEAHTAGSVVSASSSSPAFAVDGVVASVGVGVGAEVRAGDVLATLDDATARARRTAAAATLDADRRARDAAARVPVSDPVWLARLDAAIATDRAGVTDADRALGATVLRAPQDGTVSDVAVHPGDRITATSPPAVHLADLGSLVVAAALGPREVASVTAGQDVVVTVDSTGPDGSEPGPTAVPGRITAVAPAPGPDGRYGLVVETLLPPTARIGAPAEVTVVLARHTGVLVVPAAAVGPRGAGPAVLVSGPDGVRVRPVVVGLTGPEGVEIVDGLLEGDLVVVPGSARTGS